MTSTRSREAELVAIRMLRDSQSLRQIIDATGLTETDIRALAAEAGGRPRPKPAPHTQPCEHITDLPLHALLAHPANVRTDLDVDAGMVETVAEHGILQPLLVMRQDQTYVLLDGHRRLEAARRAGLARVPVRLHEPVDTTDATLLMLVTGLQKLDLDPLDEAAAYKRLADTGRTHQQIGELVGKQQAHVSQRIMLLLLTDDEKLALRQKALTLTQAYWIASQRGSNRKPGGSPERPKPKRVFHLTSDHRLAQAARELCAHSGHAVVLRLGPACGRCWEDVIRHDERDRLHRQQETQP